MLIGVDHCQMKSVKVAVKITKQNGKWNLTFIWTLNMCRLQGLSSMYLIFKVTSQRISLLPTQVTEHTCICSLVDVWVHSLAKNRTQKVSLMHK